jgi:hypothetical protein
MFASPQQFAHPIPAGIAEPGYSYWRAVEITLATQWYVVGIGDRVDDGWVMRDLLVSWPNDLLSVIRPTDRTMTISVQVMQPNPSAVNAPWQLIELASIWTAEHPHVKKRQCIVFEDVAGVRLVDPLDRVEIGDLSDLQLAWKAPSSDSLSSS